MIKYLPGYLDAGSPTVGSSRSWKSMEMEIIRTRHRSYSTNLGYVRPMLACDLDGIPVMEQLPPLPAPIDPTYQFDLVMSEFSTFVTEPYHFLGPVEDGPDIAPDQAFALF
ncbi:hypothetical protein Vadar_020961 [Vaccinium darrowii]|nr:hypothetical protein Vadar_020961 [Vaccinium darrowii]